MLSIAINIPFIHFIHLVMRTHFLFQRGPITSTWEGGIGQKLHMQTKNQES